MGNFSVVLSAEKYKKMTQAKTIQKIVFVNYECTLHICRTTEVYDKRLSDHNIPSELSNYRRRNRSNNALQWVINLEID